MAISCALRAATTRYWRLLARILSTTSPSDFERAWDALYMSPVTVVNSSSSTDSLESK